MASLLAGVGQLSQLAKLWLGRWTRDSIVSSNRFPIAAISTGMGDRLRADKPLQYYISPSHPGQLSLLPSAGREMSNSAGAVMLCVSGVKVGLAHYMSRES